MTVSTFFTPTPELSVPQTQTPPVQETRAQHTIARVLGASSFATIAWRQFLREGVLVQLHIGRCRFSTRLLLEDMGVHIEDATVREKLARWTTLGEKRLLPEAYMRALARVESSARYVLKEHAFRTELGNFVPVTAYEAWREQTEALHDEYLALRDEIITHHQDLMRQVLAEYEIIAADTYQRLRTTHPDLVPSSQQAFVATYCNRIAAQIPSIERIRDSFSFRFFRVESTRHLDPASRESENDFPGPRVEEGEADQDAPSGMSALRQENERRARARALLEQDIRQDARQRTQALLDNFLTSIVAHLRTLTYEAVTDVLATMERRGGESFSPRSTVQLNNLLRQIQALNFFGDEEIEQIMARVERIVVLSPAERQRSLPDIQRQLRAIATVTRATLLDLEEDPRTPRAELGLPAYPTAQMIHAARAELRLPDLDAARLAELPNAARVPVRAELAEPGEGSLWSFARRNGAETRAARSL